MDLGIVKTVAEASPWAALLLLTLWRFDVFNNRLISENRDREERMLTDSKEREAGYAHWINRLEASFETMADHQRVLAEEVSRIREDIEDIKGELRK